VFGLARAQYDKDESGTIDFEEFLDMAKVLVGSRTNFRESLPWKYGSGEAGQQVLTP
jgi:Ca2+-binding EF-hand superfamily protein